MAEYDYEAARAHFDEAMASTGGSQPAAHALLELLVEHLALDGVALSLEPQLSQTAAADPEVRALLALAAARTDDASAALRFLKGLSGARAADTWEALSRAAVERGAADEVDRFLDRLADCHPTRPDLHRQREEATRLRSEECRPAEEELRHVIDSGDEAAIESAARAVLARWPESAVAGQALARVKERRRRAEADRLLAMATAWPGPGRGPGAPWHPWPGPPKLRATGVDR